MGLSQAAARPRLSTIEGPSYTTESQQGLPPHSMLWLGGIRPHSKCPSSKANRTATVAGKIDEVHRATSPYIATVFSLSLRHLAGCWFCSLGFIPCFVAVQRKNELTSGVWFHPQGPRPAEKHAGPTIGQEIRGTARCHGVMVSWCHGAMVPGGIPYGYGSI